MVKVAVYGSLLRGEYNSNRYSGKYLYSVFLKDKWVMTYDECCKFPKLCRSNEENLYYFEVFDFDKRVFKDMRDMEVSYGYIPVEYEYNGDKFIIFISRDKFDEKYPFPKWSAKAWYFLTGR